MNIYDMFETDDDFEVNGIWLDYGQSRVKVARSGGKNTSYGKALTDELSKLNKSSLKSLTPEENSEILAGVYANTVIKGNEVKDEKGNWKSGVFCKVDNKIKVVPYNKENIKRNLLDLPEYFNEIIRYSENFTNYRVSIEEEQVKN